MTRRQEKALTLNGVTAPNVQTEGNHQIATNKQGTGSMNTTKPLNKITMINTCLVVPCVGPFYDNSSHADENPEYNLHYAAGYDGDLPLEVHPVMDSTSWPYWRLSVDVPARGDEHTPAAAIAIARVITEQAEHTQALNDEIDAQEWLDTHPDPDSELVGEIMRDNPIAVTLRIMERLTTAPPVIDYSGHTVANSAGYVIDPESILMQSIVNADESRSLDRSRFFVNVGA